MQALGTRNRRRIYGELLKTHTHSFPALKFFGFFPSEIRLGFSLAIFVAMATEYYGFNKIIYF